MNPDSVHAAAATRVPGARSYRGIVKRLGDRSAIVESVNESPEPLVLMETHRPLGNEQRGTDNKFDAPGLRVFWKHSERFLTSFRRKTFYPLSS